MINKIEVNGVEHEYDYNGLANKPVSASISNPDLTVLTGGKWYIKLDTFSNNASTQNYDFYVVDFRDSLGNKFKKIKFQRSSNDTFNYIYGYTEDDTKTLIYACYRLNSSSSATAHSGLATYKNEEGTAIFLDESYYLIFESDNVEAGYSGVSTTRLIEFVMQKTFTKVGIGTATMNVDELILNTGKVATEAYVDEKIANNSSGSTETTESHIFYITLTLTYSATNFDVNAGGDLIFTVQSPRIINFANIDITGLYNALNGLTLPARFLQVDTVAECQGYVSITSDGLKFETTFYNMGVFESWSIQLSDTTNYELTSKTQTFVRI